MCVRRAHSRSPIAPLTPPLSPLPRPQSLPLAEASRLCNEEILRRVQQVICFAFHDSRLLLDTVARAKELRKMVTLLYLD